MKLSDIKTHSEFNTVAYCWSQRAKSMVDIWNNKDETEDRKNKAFKVWNFYSSLYLLYLAVDHKLSMEALKKFQSTESRIKYKSGSIPLDKGFNETGEEIITDKFGIKKLIPDTL